MSVELSCVDFGVVVSPDFCFFHLTCVLAGFFDTPLFSQCEEMHIHVFKFDLV